MNIQFARPLHYEEVLGIHLKRRFAYSSLRETTPGAVKEFQEKKILRIFDHMQAHSDLVLLVAEKCRSIAGYMLLYFGDGDEISETPHCDIIDLHGIDGDVEVLKALIEKAEALVREVRFKYLVITWPQKDLSMQKFLGEIGFCDEQYLFLVSLKHMKHPRAKQGPDAGWSITEPDSAEVVGEIMEIGKANVSSLISPFRRVALPQAEENFLKYFSNLARWMEQRADFVTLCARRRSTEEVIGFLLLHLQGKLAGYPVEFFKQNTIDQMTGEPQGTIHYISVERGFRGKFLSFHLIRECIRLLRERGLHHFSGEVLCTNYQALSPLKRRFGGGIEMEKVQKLKVCR